MSAEGVAMDPDKIKLVSEWPEPTSVKEVRSFLGLAGYYWRFVRGYAEVTAPLHELTKKDVIFKWTGETQLAFDTLKAALTSPILAMPTDDGRWCWTLMHPINLLERCYLRFKAEKNVSLPTREGYWTNARQITV